MTDAEWQALVLALRLVAPKDLATLKCVSRQLRRIGSDAAVQKEVFVHFWKLQGTIGQPKHTKFYEASSLHHFVRRYEIQRFDTLQMLAVKFHTDVGQIKRTNNLMSDTSLLSRQHIYIPAVDASQISGCTVGFEYCPLACREFAVIVQPNSCAAAKRKGQSKGVTRMQISSLRAKLSLILGRSLHIDEDTAKFYLEDANGDLKLAITQFEHDAAWEAGTAGPIRKVPVQKWIAGEHGL